jgi:uncharacterized protein (TIGR03000 family)
MFRRLWLFGSVLVLTGSLVLMAAEAGRAAGPGGGVFQGGRFAPPPSTGMQAGSRFNPTSIYPPLSYEPYRLYPYYSYNYNYGLYPYYNRRSTNYSYSSGYQGIQDDMPSTEAYPGGTAPYVAVPGAAGARDTDPTQVERRAHLTVQVPPHAEVWFDDFKTKTTGTARDFQTPPLRPGKYGYTVRARWQEDGREVTQTRDVTLSPGADIHLTFPLPAGSKDQGENPRQP